MLTDNQLLDIRTLIYDLEHKIKVPHDKINEMYNLLTNEVGNLAHKQVVFESWSVADIWRSLEIRYDKEELKRFPVLTGLRTEQMHEVLKGMAEKGYGINTPCDGIDFEVLEQSAFDYFDDAELPEFSDDFLEITKHHKEQRK